MSWLRALRFVILGLGLAYAFPAACGSGGVVGGKCRAGYSNCNGECVDLQADFRSCGTCGNECAGELACVQGLCGGEDGGVVRPEGGASNMGTAGNGNQTAGQGQGGEGLLDGGFFDSPVDGQGDAMAPLECLPPHNVPAHCGDCETECTAEAPYCQPDGNGSFVCVPMCESPLVLCQGRCMLDPDDFRNDAENCGACGVRCPSDICLDYACRGASYGNVALLCSDFNSASADSAPTVLLGNAVFMPPANPVKVLAYTKGASSSAVARVDRVIGWAGDARGRTAAITNVKTVAEVNDMLSTDDFQVFLIHDLDQAPAGEAGQVGAGWASNNLLAAFTKAGGTVVVLDGADGTGEMHELISAAGLLPGGIDGQTDVTGAAISNQAPFDVLGVNVLSPFLGTSHTCIFDTSVTEDDETLFVLTDPARADAPVAIHRVITPE